MKKLIILIIPILIFFLIHMIKVHPISHFSFEKTLKEGTDEMLQIGDDMLANTYDMYCMWAGQKDSKGNLMKYWNGRPVKEGENPICSSWPRK